MDATDPRSVLDALIRDRGEDYASLSRLLGRNPAYVQQFIKRGIPKKLDEEDRAVLARYFGVEEHLLGGPRTSTPRIAASSAGGKTADLVLVDRLDVRASAGPGTFASEEKSYPPIAFDRAWLRGLTSGGPGGLSMIRVSSDSMTPTLTDGDEILVDRDDAGAALRDGIYVLRVDEALMVKRLELNPSTRRITVRSDNPTYPVWADCDPATIAVIGRVVWAGRRVG
jgi:phage repressor protein C with HTH and peptisase S24 domain